MHVSLCMYPSSVYFFVSHFVHAPSLSPANIQTGDIEDFPGLDSLPMYQISREGGKIFLLFDDASELTHRRVKDMAEKDDRDQAFVILGDIILSVIIRSTNK